MNEARERDEFRGRRAAAEDAPHKADTPFPETVSSDSGNEDGPSAKDSADVAEELDAVNKANVAGEAVSSEEAPEANEVELVRAQADEWQNRWLRLQADFDNFRRRARQEKEELAEYASSKLVADLLPVLDNFLLALEAGKQAAEAETLMKGVEMVYGQMREVLERVGLRAMEAVGSPFDPSLHEAVGSEASDEYPAGSVVAVLRSGYHFKDKVLRPAMVKVSE